MWSSYSGYDLNVMDLLHGGSVQTIVVSGYEWSSNSSSLDRLLMPVHRICFLRSRTFSSEYTECTLKVGLEIKHLNRNI